MRNTIILFILVSLLSCWGCSSGRPDHIELTILCTTDMSSQMLPLNLNTDQPSNQSLASFQTLIKDQSRLQDRQNCFVFDMGNKAFSGATNFYFSYVDTTSEHLVFRSNRLIGYEAMSLGSRDFKNTQMIEQLLRHPDLASSYLCANLVYLHNLEPVFTPYRIFERDGITVAVLAMTSPCSLYGEDMFHYEIIDMVECAQRWMPEIQSHHPDLVIGLFSCDTEYDSYGRTLESYLNPAGGLPTAILVPGFDVVVLHDCPATQSSTVTNVEGKTIPYFAMSARGEHANIIKVRMNRSGDSYQKRIFGTSADLSLYQPDPDYCEAIGGIQDTLRRWVNAPLGYLGDSIYGALGMFGPDAYASFLNQIQLFDGLADLSIASCLIGTDTFPAGPITMRRVFSIFPFENELDYLQLSGEEVLRALEWMAARQYDQILPGEEEHVLAYVRDKKGVIQHANEGYPILKTKPVSYSSIGGLNYTVDLTKPAGQRVKVYGLQNGQPFDLSRLYTIALNSFLVSNGHNFITEGLRWDIEKLMYRTQTGRRESLRSVTARLFESLHGDTLYLQPDNNWSLVPSDYCRRVIPHELTLPLKTR